MTFTMLPQDPVPAKGAKRGLGRRRSEPAAPVVPVEAPVQALVPAQPAPRPVVPQQAAAPAPVEYPAELAALLEAQDDLAGVSAWPSGPPAQPGQPGLEDVRTAAYEVPAPVHAAPVEESFPAAWHPEPVQQPVQPVQQAAPAPAPAAAAPVALAPVLHRPAPTGSSVIAPVAGVLALTGAVGGYAVARWVGVEALVLAGLAWWLVSAVVLSLLVKRSSTTAAIVSLFLFVLVGLPLAGAGTAYGLAQRAADALATVADFSSEVEADLDAGVEGDF